MWAIIDSAGFEGYRHSRQGKKGCGLERSYIYLVHWLYELPVNQFCLFPCFEIFLDSFLLLLILIHQSPCLA